MSTNAVTPLIQLSQCQAASLSQDSIVGGKEVGLGDWDQNLVAMLRLRRQNHESICTATLLSDRVLITAAHCVDGLPASSIRAQFLTSEGCLGGQVRPLLIQVGVVVIHKDFDGTPQSLADLALLYLEESAPANQQRLALLPENEEPTTKKVLLLGFGITAEDKKDSQVLRRIVRDLNEDIKIQGRSVLIDQTSNKGGFCRGDSGAPVLTEVRGKTLIMAINSANIGIEAQRECQTMSLGMNAVYFRNWILKNQSKLENSSWLERLITIPSVSRSD